MYKLNQAIYHWTNPYSRLDGQWEKVDEIKIDPEFPIFPICKGGSLSFVPIKRKDFADYKEACIYWGPGLSKTAYAIDSEGRVYLWFHGIGEYGGMVPIISSISGGIYGCLFGLSLILIVAISKFLNRKLRPQHEGEIQTSLKDYQT